MTRERKRHVDMPYSDYIREEKSAFFRSSGASASSVALSLDSTLPARV